MAFAKAVAHVASGSAFAETLASVLRGGRDDADQQALVSQLLAATAASPDVADAAQLLSRLLCKRAAATRVEGHAGARAAAVRLKDSGNACYARGEIARAVQHYTVALGEHGCGSRVGVELAPASAGGGGGHDGAAAAVSLRAVLLANRAAALSGLGAFDAAASDATAAVLSEPTYAKAWYRLHECTREVAFRTRALALAAGSTGDGPGYNLPSEAARGLLDGLLAARSSSRRGGLPGSPGSASPSRVSVAWPGDGASDRAGGAGAVLRVSSTGHSGRSDEDAGDGGGVAFGAVLLREAPLACVALFDATAAAAAQQPSSQAGLRLPRCTRCMRELLAPAAGTQHYSLPCANSTVCGGVWCSAACAAADWRDDHRFECPGACACCGAADGSSGALPLLLHQLLPREVLLALRLLRAQRRRQQDAASPPLPPLLFHLARLPPQQVAELAATALLAARLLLAASPGATPADADIVGGFVHADVDPRLSVGGGGLRHRDPALAACGGDATHLARELLVALAQLVCNAHGVKVVMPDGQHQHRQQQQEELTVGLAVYATASFANHSCAPSAVTLFDGRELALVALAPLAPGDEVTISYGPTAARQPDAAARQALLRRKYAFTCGCTACAPQTSANSSSGDADSGGDAAAALAALARLRADGDGPVSGGGVDVDAAVRAVTAPLPEALVAAGGVEVVHELATLAGALAATGAAQRRLRAYLSAFGALAPASANAFAH